jgi:predicted oxidoreductase
MNKIYLSDSGPKVSEAIYGFWRWTNEGESSINAIEKTVNLCLELGINTFDHADLYGNFQAEELFGQVISKGSIKRDQVVLFTKCGSKISPKGFVYADNSRAYITESINNSLRKLKTDYVDIFLLDALDHTVSIEETAVVLDELVSSGKARHIGISNFTPSQHQLLATYLNKPIVTNHISLNLLDVSAIVDGTVDYIKQRYAKPLVWSPLAGGRILNGTDAKAIKVRTKLAEIGKKYNANIEQTAVAWLVKTGALPIIGSLNETRIRNAASAFSIDMTREEWYELFDAAKNG